MYDISQLYAIKLDRLHELNQIPYGTEPQVGVILQLRRAGKARIAVPLADEPVRESDEDTDFIIDLGL
jgi:hypothetical protein